MRADYRGDIDGLRALAVLSVLAFHLTPHALGGGYIGVDVFFVVSGYLITLQLQQLLESGRFSFSSFYKRRLRRLFPAAFATTVVSAVGAAFILPPTLLEEFWGSVLFSSVSLGNFYFYGKSGYFESAAQTKPLLHLWSLGVEEQFYLLWPALLSATEWLRRKNPLVRVTPVLLGLGAFSLFWSVVSIDFDAQSAFFFPHLRAWEFCIGGIAGLSFRRRSLPPLGAEAACAIGLLFILGPLFSYTATTQFPGWAALAPCFGTALILVAGGPKYTAWLLKTRAAALVGRASYSIYLVHWPLLVLYMSQQERAPTFTEALLLAAVSLVLGYLSWRFIEQPFRVGVSKTDHWTAAGFPLACASLTLIVICTSAVLWKRSEADSAPGTPRNQRMLAFLEADNAWANRRTSKGGCFVFAQEFAPERCMALAPEETRPRILLAGDSLAANLYPGLKAHLGDGVRIDLAAAQNCRPVLEPKVTGRSCRSRTQALFKDKDLARYDLILLRGNFHEAEEITQLKESIELLRAHGAAQVAVIGAGMFYRSRIAEIISQHQDLDHEQLLIHLNEQLHDRNLKAEVALRQAVEGAEVPFISVLEHQCPELKMSNCTHTIGRDGDPITRDNIHFSLAGSIWWLGKAEGVGSPWARLLQPTQRKTEPVQAD